MSTHFNNRKRRVLIVEDEGIVALELEARIQALGYEVVGIAGTAAEALRLAASAPPDLVLMDIHIRGEVDGIDLARQFRRSDGPAVLFLTAHFNDAILQRAKFTEPLAYLLKPYQENELKVALELAVYRQRMEKERMDLTRRLEQALAEVKTLRGLIPICAWCRKLRDDEGFWLSLENYLRSNTAAACTHSICPSCYAKQMEQAAAQRGETNQPPE